MDAKVTLSFDADVIRQAKQLAKKHNISLAMLVEFLLLKSINHNAFRLDDLPINDWINTMDKDEMISDSANKID